MHKTSKIIVTRANVDRGIVPVVKWLNRLHGVETTHCCQGSSNELPYVLFRCCNSFAMVHIATLTDKYVSVIKIHWHAEFGMRWHMEFKNVKALNSFQRRILTVDGKTKKA